MATTKSTAATTTVQPTEQAAAATQKAPDTSTETTAKTTTPKVTPTVKKTAAKKSTVKKAAAKKTAVKKAAATKIAATKAPAKQSVAKKTPVKKATAKKAVTSAPHVSVVPVDEVAPTTADREVSLGTDAAFADPAPAATKVVRNVSEIRHHLRTNDVPVFFFGATPFNLLGLDRWVRNFSYISYYDGWDGAHPRVFTPRDKPYVAFESGEDINHWLLQNEEVRSYIASKTPAGQRPKVAMVFFEEETEQICEEAGYDLILPSAALRHRLDSKLETTRMADEAGVPSVPNVMASVQDWASLRSVADAAGLGDDLVIQSAYGDSGKTTYFVDGPESFEAHAEDIIGIDVKIMRRIDNFPVAVEAVLTSCGTIVGPFMSELTGHSELTPYRGGWCGNEMFPGVLSDKARAKATDMVKRLGDRIGQEGYRGFFEVDVLVDLKDDEVYLGELNPRISGASAITNVTAGAYADVPLFLFHLMDYLDVEMDIDVDEINERWQRISGADQWSQMIVKEIADGVQLIVSAAATGQYILAADSELLFRRAALDWHQLQNESEAFFLRIYGVGEYRWKGADLGVLVTKGRLQEEVDGELVLTQRARALIDAVRARYTGVSVDADGLPVSAAK